MIRAALVAFAVLSVFFAPVPVIIVANIIGAFASPIVPLASGILVDALYRAPLYGAWPWGTILGALMGIIAFGIRKVIAARITGV